MSPRSAPFFPARRRLRLWRGAVLAAAAALAGGWLTALPPLAAEDTIEQLLPETRQRVPLRYEMLRVNNNAVFVGAATPGGNQNQMIYSVQVREVFKAGNNGRTIAPDDALDVQVYRGVLKPDTNYIFPIYLWGANNPGVCQTMPIELKKDYKNDPVFKALSFTLKANLPTDPEIFTAVLWKLYQELPPQDILEDGRLELLAFVAAEHGDRIDPENVDFAAEMDRLLHTELLGNAERLHAAENGDVNKQYQMERALAAVAQLYSRRPAVNTGEEIGKLLSASPLAISACYPLVDRCEDKDKPAVVEKLMPLVDEQLKNKQTGHRAVQVLYLVRLLKSEKLTAPIKKALEDDLNRPDALLLARALVAVEGADCWTTIAPLFDKQFDWQNNNMLIEGDLIRMTIEKIGKPSFPQLVKSIKKNQQLQNVIYQVFNGMPPDQREEFGYQLLDAGVHNVLSFMLNGNTTNSPRLIEYVLRYAVGEVSADNDMERNLLNNAAVNARQYLRNLLGCEVATRTAFNEWYLDRLNKVELPLTAELKAKLPGWQRDLASPQGDIREQAQKELHNLGADALPVLLHLEHGTRDLTTRQTARAMILQLPLAAEAFSAGQ